MKQAAINYGQALFESKVTPESVEQARMIYQGSSQLEAILKSPVVDYTKKAKIIERIFPGEIRNFLKLVCYYHKAEYLRDIFQVYEMLKKEEESILLATLFYTALPDEEYIEEMKKFLRKKYGKKQVELKLVQDLSLMGGFVLQVGYTRYDCSVRGAMARLQQKLMRR